MLHPEFELSPGARIALGVRDLLREPRWGLTSVLTSIDDMEVDSVLLDGHYRAPTMGVAIDYTDEARDTSSRGNKVVVGILIFLVTENLDSGGTDRFLRDRLFERVRRAVTSGGGCIEHEGETVSDAIVRFQRLPTPTRVGQGTQLATTLRIAFETRIKEDTRIYV